MSGNRNYDFDYLDPWLWYPNDQSRFSESWMKMSAARPWRIKMLLALTIGSLAALHFAETLVWATPVSLMGFIPSIRDSYFFVLASYTTLGEGSVSLPDQWRLLGPIIAMSGLFTFVAESVKANARAAESLEELQRHEDAMTISRLY